MRWDHPYIKRSVGVVLVLLVAGLVQAAIVEFARVNGKVITRKHLEDALSGLNGVQRENILKDLNSRRQVLNSLIDQELLVQQAEREKLDKDSAYQEAITAFRRQYLATRWAEQKLTGKLTVSAAKSHYNAFKNRYSTDQIEAQHILLPDEKTALEILKMVKTPGADFQIIAEKHSRDPSAKNNRGDLGRISRDSPFVEEFKDGAFLGAEGQIVGPIQTIYGYHIVKINKKIPGRVMGYDEVEARVMNDLRQSLLIDQVSALRRMAKITVNEKALQTP